MTKVFTIADALPPTHQLICKFTQVVEIMRCRTLFPLVSAAIRKKVDAVGEVLNCRQLHAGAGRAPAGGPATSPGCKSVERT